VRFVGRPPNGRARFLFDWLHLLREKTSAMTDNEVLALLDESIGQKKLTPAAGENIRIWLTEPRYSDYASLVIEHMRAGKWKQLDDVFWTIIPFGTGGRRGRMYPIGTNAINDRTIGESAAGLATYVLSQHRGAGEPACGIAYDTRHNSRHFAELCAGIMVAAGFRVYFLDDYRSTPELSFLVRHKQCACGIMVTASHNPPSDNAVKVYWSTGGQVLPPHDKKIIQQVGQVGEIRRVDFREAVRDGRVVLCTQEVDAAYLGALQQQRFPGPRNIKVLYSPLHGVGAASVLPALAADGFADVELYGPHAERSGDFPNVPGHSANPENPAVFSEPIRYARQVAADVILATDPDCDRLGCAAPLTLDASGEWGSLSGNQIGALLADFVLEQRRKQGALSAGHFVIKTLVTTEMIRRIADSYGVTTYGDLLVGFKWICGKMDDEGADRFVFGTEESHGYLVGEYARDKDGAVACLLMAELVAELKQQKKSLHQKLDDLYWQHGYHAERLLNVQMEGSEGMQQMQKLMERLRVDPPRQLAGLNVAGVRDYENQLQRSRAGEKVSPLAGPRGDLVILDFAEQGNCVAARPSGTEPKVKFYMFSYTPAEQLANLENTRQQTAARMSDLEKDLRAFIKTI
jgi:phosphomannomutase